MRWRRSSGHGSPLGLSIAGWALLTGAVCFIGVDASARSSKGILGIELSKLVPQGGACHAYFVLDNTSSVEYQELKLDLVIFQPDGVFERRFAMEVAPLEADRRTVKLFELNDTACNKIGSLLINGVIECKATPRSKKDCMSRLVPTSRSDVELIK